MSVRRGGERRPAAFPRWEPVRGLGRPPLPRAWPVSLAKPASSGENLHAAAAKPAGSGENLRAAAGREATA